MDKVIRNHRLDQLSQMVVGLPPDALYFWRWKMEKGEFQMFSRGLEPKATLNFGLTTTVANPGIWFALLNGSRDRAGLVLQIVQDEIMPFYEGLLGHDALASFFGLSREEEAFIFKGESYFVRHPGSDNYAAFVHPTLESVEAHISQTKGSPYEATESPGPQKRPKPVQRKSPRTR